MSHRLLTTLPVVASGGGGLVLPQVASATLLLDLRASQLALADGAPVSTWADKSGSGRDFTRGTGSNGLTKQSSGGIPHVEFNGVDDWMLGPVFADDLLSFAIFYIGREYSDTNGSIVICKLDVDDIAGWDIIPERLECVNDGQIPIKALSSLNLADDAFHSYEFTKGSNNVVDMDTFIDGSDASVTRYGTVITGFSNSSPVTLAVLNNDNAYEHMSLRTILVYSPVPNLADRAAINAWLATNP